MEFVLLSARSTGRFSLLFACAWLACACTGTFGSPAGSDGSGPGPGQPTDDHEGSANDGFAPATPTLHRLTNTEYVRSVEQLLGAGLRMETELEADTALKGFTSIGAAELTIAHTTAEKLEAAALELTGQVFSDPARREALVGCAPEGLADPCVARFVKAFGRRAFRRPLAAEESTAFTDLAKRLEGELGDKWEALAYVVSAFLQSPDFVFRVEVGEADPSAPFRLRFTSLEMASRLSFVLWRSMPDDALLDAGERGELVNEDAVRREATRMVDDPRFDDTMLRFFSENLALERLDTLSKEPAVYPQMSQTLPSAMRGELEHMFREIALSVDGDFRDLLDTRRRFVNGELAALYGIEGVSGDAFVPVDMPEDSARVGILGSAGLMAIQATTTNTSPTRRGKFIRNRLLCQEVPAPPPGADTTLPEADTSLTMRDRLARHASDAECKGCHTLMDPMGLALESFDGIGAFRDSDRGMALDLTGNLDGKPFDGPVEMAALLRDHARIGPCVVQQLYRFASGHQETPGERPVLDALEEEFEGSNYHLPSLMLALVSSDGFRFAARPEGDSK